MSITTIILLAVFISAAALVLGVMLWLDREPSLGHRLEVPQGAHEALDRGGEGAGWPGKLIKLAGPIARLSSPKEGGSATHLRVRFLNAGLREAYWPTLFFGFKVLLALLLPLLFFIYSGLTQARAMAPPVVPLTLLLSALGFYLPNGVLHLHIRHRQRELEEAMPDAIDLMTVCVEAGLALDAAMKRTCEELHLRSQALAEELSLVTLELQVGASRESALHNLALRTGIDDVATFVTILLQSERFGTNVADSLRTLAEIMRENRRQRAEELAAKMPTKMLFPLIFFIFPALFVVLLGPALISIFRILLPGLGGNP